jgi:hypothetical protein
MGHWSLNEDILKGHIDQKRRGIYVEEAQQHPLRGIGPLHNNYFAMKILKNPFRKVNYASS